ncbi:MAG TPA: hypothetical protein VF945_13960, partial [Polyangia bacterium]
IDHQRAYPDVLDPKRTGHVDDGVIEGRACNLALQFYADWWGPRVTLQGRAQVPWDTTFPARDGVGLTLTIHELGPGHRRITGTPAGNYTFPIDIDVSPERLVAQVGQRWLDLKTVEDHYLVGTVENRQTPAKLAQLGEAQRQSTFVIYGRELLRTMVPADEALILLFMLSCNGSIEYRGKLERGFSLVPIADADVR